MSVISRGSFQKDLVPFIGKWWGESYKDYDSLIDQIFTVKKMTSASIENALLPGFGLPYYKAEGGSVRYDTTQAGGVKRFTAVDYALGFIITRNMMDDGTYLKNGEKFTKALKRSMLHGKEILANQVLDRYINTSYTGYDGKPLCSTTHPSQVGDQANRPSSDADLSEASLKQADIDIGLFKDDRGLLICAKPRKLIVSRSDRFLAERLLMSTGRVETADNDVNPVKNLKLIPEGYVVNDRQTDQDQWALLTDVVEDGLEFYNRRDIELTSDNDFDTENAKFKAIMRVSMGWTDWRCYYASAGA